ncbi:MAG: FprA family A-type flavoprotein [Bacteroidales bacterium]|nr:FprA family A-type flavoprotein [Bacteroidales bacterium]
MIKQKIMTDDKVIDINKDVKWIGVLDPDLVTFDVVMETKEGTTYNSYFINAEKKAVIETTKVGFWNTYLEKLQQVTQPEEIEYIILNHTEPDHSGNLRNLLNLAPKATVVGSGNAIRYLRDLVDTDFKSMVVKNGDTLDLGNKTLEFIGAPNLHWPDTIYTYLKEDKLLFTCDSFGCHYCDERMIDNQVGNFDEAFKYYFDVILKPFSKFMLKAIEKIKPLEIDAILPGHGPLLLNDWKKWVDLSEKYAREAVKYPEANRVFIPYVSAYHKTGDIAEAIAAGIREFSKDIEVDVCDIEMMPVGEMEEKITRANALLVGSPTINQNILLPIYKLFAVMTPLRDKGKLAGSFGSYGWSGEAAPMLNNMLQQLKLKVFGEGVFIKFSPDNDDSAKAREYGKAFAEALIKK